MTKLIVAVTVNYNRKSDTLSCLKTFEQVKLASGYDLRIIVVDNASTGDDVVEIKHRFPDVKVLESESNLGFTGGNNLGIRYANEMGLDYLLLINNDTLVDSKFLHCLIEDSIKHPNAGILSPKIYFAPGNEFHKTRYVKSERGKVIWYAGGRIDWNNVYGINIGVNEVDKGQYDKHKSVDLATGCCMLLTRKALDLLGQFDDRYFMYYEDTDLCMRWKLLEGDIRYVPSSVIWHVNAASSGSGSGLQDYYISRNRMLFGMTYAPLKTKLSLVKESFRLLWKGRKWQKIGVKDYYLSNWRKGNYK